MWTLAQLSKHFRQWRVLPSDRRALLIDALATLGQLKLLFLTSSYSSYRPRHSSTEDLPLPNVKAIDNTRWAVHAAAWLFPWHVTCLQRALCGQKLLFRHYGINSSIRFGVADAATPPLKAHAWLDCHGTTVLGDESESTKRYTLLHS